MKKKFCFFVLLCSLCFAGCGNGNMFSWAHDEGSGDFDSVMSDAEAAMKDKEYSKAAKYYKSALKKKGGDAKAVYGYCSASFAAAAGSNYQNIIESVISGSGPSSTGLLGFLNIKDAQRLHTALNEILQSDMLPSILHKAENNVDANLNAAIAYLLLAATSILTDPAININDLNINADFSITAPDAISAALAIINAVNNNILPNLENAKFCLNNIDSDEQGSIARQLDSEIAKLQQQLHNKGYSGI